MFMKKSLGISAAVLLIFTGIALTSDPHLRAEEPRTAGKQLNVTDTYKALNLFGDVFEQARSNYVDPVEDKKLVEYALNGMLSSLDPHSGYMTDEETKAMSVQNRGEFGGLGIEVTMDNGVVKVVSPIDDTPAARAGIQSGDLIVEIDEKRVMGMTLSEAVDKMRGKVGSHINLTIVRQNVKDPIKMKITRDTIKIKSVKHRIESGNVGYIRVTTFNAQTASGLNQAFSEIKKTAGDKLIGYVLDLRNNPGGLLEQAIAVADDFIDQGEIVSTRGRNPDDTRRDKATPGDKASGLPLVVLINGGSASASEIVAGALQDHKRGILMGTQSFGKGSVQTLFDVPGGGSIKLTTARYYTPSGRSIQATGIVPDIIVERAKVVEEKDTFSEIHEADLKGALRNPNGEDDSSNADDTSKKQDSASEAKDAGDPEKDKKNEDYQLIRAIDLLQGISLYTDKGAPMAQAAPLGAASGKKFDSREK